MKPDCNAALPLDNLSGDRYQKKVLLYPRSRVKLSSLSNTMSRVAFVAYLCCHLLTLAESASPSPSLQTERPTILPTITPVSSPTGAPTDQTTESPTGAPFDSPTREPTISPVTAPASTALSLAPSADATPVPTKIISFLPTSESPSSLLGATTTQGLSASPSPTAITTQGQSQSPSSLPTATATQTQSQSPSSLPTATTTQSPSSLPTATITQEPSQIPSSLPTATTTQQPSQIPSSLPSVTATSEPSESPTRAPSERPSLRPSDSPSYLPSGAPSFFPSFGPSKTPSHEPSTRPSVVASDFPSQAPSTDVPVTGMASVEMNSFAYIIDSESKSLLEDKMERWLADALRLVTPPFYSVSAQINAVCLTNDCGGDRRHRLLRPIEHSTEQQIRGLQTLQPLLVYITVSAEFTPSSTTPTVESAYFENVLRDVFTDQGSTLSAELLELSETDSEYKYFSTMTDVKGLELESVSQNEVSEEDINNDHHGGKSAIVLGSVAGAAALLLLSLVLYTFLFKKKKSSNKEKVLGIADRDFVTCESERSGHGFNNNNYDAPARRPSIDEDEETHGDRSQKTFQTLDHLYSQDNQSYAYSADDDVGFRSSFVSPLSVGPLDLPMEVDRPSMLYTVKIEKNYTYDEDIEMRLGSPSSVYTRDEVNRQFLSSSSPSADIKLTPVQINKSLSASSSTRGIKKANSSKRDNQGMAMLISSTSDISQRGVDDKGMEVIMKEEKAEEKKEIIRTCATGMEDGKYRRDCYAPPGKLGVVIDTTDDGSVVYEIKAGSPLSGVIFPGDKIISVDDHDTSKLSSGEITKIMLQKMDAPRKITTLSSHAIQ